MKKLLGRTDNVGRLLNSWVNEVARRGPADKSLRRGLTNTTILEKVVGNHFTAELVQRTVTRLKGWKRPSGRPLMVLATVEDSEGGETRVRLHRNFFKPRPAVRPHDSSALDRQIRGWVAKDYATRPRDAWGAPSRRQRLRRRRRSYADLVETCDDTATGWKTADGHRLFTAKNKSQWVESGSKTFYNGPDPFLAADGVTGHMRVNKRIMRVYDDDDVDVAVESDPDTRYVWSGDDEDDDEEYVPCHFDDDSPRGGARIKGDATSGEPGFPRTPPRERRR